jgi:hypothetical protein
VLRQIVAPVIVVLVAPGWSSEQLPRWRKWLLANARTTGLVTLIVIGTLLMAKGIHDLVA